jgi:hypothetical protein
LGLPGLFLVTFFWPPKERKIATEKSKEKGYLRLIVPNILTFSIFTDCIPVFTLFIPYQA